MSDFTNDPRLKPCPLCKWHSHIAEVVRTYVPSAYFAACDNQDCRLFEVPGMAHYRDTVDEAVEAWNAMPRWYERDEVIEMMLDEMEKREHSGFGCADTHSTYFRMLWSEMGRDDG